MRANSKWLQPRRLIPLAIAAFVLLGFVSFRFTAATGVKRELAEVRKRGLPTTPLELDNWYERVPPDENAALAILKAAGDCVDAPQKKDPSALFSNSDMPLGEPLRPDILSLAAEHIARNADVISQLYAAAKLPRSRYPIDLSKAPDVAVTGLIQPKRMSQLLRWSAIVNAAKADNAATLESLEAGFAVARSLKDEPLLISQLVRMACLSIHVISVEQAVSRTQLDAGALDRLSTLARQAEDDGRRAYHRAMAGERAFGTASFMTMTYSNFQAIATWGGTPPGYDELPDFLKPILFNLRRTLGLHDRDVAFSVQTLGRLERAALLDPPEMLRQTENIFNVVNTELTDHPMRYMISRLSLPAMEKAAEKEVLLASRLRCLRAALMIEQARLKTGRLPEPSDIPAGQDWPRDAVDNQHLKYDLKNTNAFRVVAIQASAVANRWRNPASTNWQDVAFSIVRQPPSAPTPTEN